MMLSKFDINYTFLLLKQGATRNNRENQVLQTNTEPLDFIWTTAYLLLWCESYTSHSHSLCFC